jgi:hypothetical protein
MQDKTKSMRVKLAVLLCAAALCAQVPLSPTRARDAQDPPAKRLEIVGSATPFAQRTGVDDGAVLAVHFGGDTHGTLDACG